MGQPVPRRSRATRQCQPLSMAVLLNPARAGPSTLSGFYKKQGGEKPRVQSGCGLAGAAGAECPCAPLSRRHDGEPGRRVCSPLPDSSLCIHHQFRGTGCAAAPVAVFSRPGRAGLCPPARRARGARGCGHGEGAGEGNAAGAGALPAGCSRAAR